MGKSGRTTFEERRVFSSCSVYKLWVLVSELGHMEGAGVGVLGLGVCRGLRAEFRLFRTVFGVAEAGREWGAVAPRKPAAITTRQRKRMRSTVVPSKCRAIFQANYTFCWGPQKTISVFWLFYWNSIKLRPDSKWEEECLTSLQGCGNKSIYPAYHHTQ